MSGGIGGAPKFPGDLSEHLPTSDDPPDHWTARFRHAWLLYAALAVAVPLYIVALVLPVMLLGRLGWLVSLMVMLFPAAVYFRLWQWRMITGRDPVTGERMAPRDR